MYLDWTHMYLTRRLQLIATVITCLYHSNLYVLQLMQQISLSYILCKLIEYFLCEASKNFFLEIDLSFDINALKVLVL